MRALIFGAVAALLASTSADATIIVTHWSGVLYSGSDPTDVFGTGNPDLAGVAYDIVGTLDTEKGVYFNYGYPNGDYLRSDLYGTHMSPGSATLTINGHSIDFGTYPSYELATSIFAYNNNGGRSVLREGFADWINDGETYNDLNIRAIAYDGYNPASIFTDVPEGFCLNAGACDGSFTFNGGRGKPALVQGQFGPYFYLAAPEPATWAMMIVGFGMAGGALRRRRTALAA